jgi:FtsP/CotA-like multicopper oxidase with cupredoxin domain
VTLFVISALSEEQLIQKREITNQEILKSFLPLKATAKPQTRSFNLQLTRKRISPDGLDTEAFVINGQYPGSIIHVNKGDTIRANVVNRLGVATSKEKNFFFFPSFLRYFFFSFF